MIQSILLITESYLTGTNHWLVGTTVVVQLYLVAIEVTQFLHSTLVHPLFDCFMIVTKGSNPLEIATPKKIYQHCIQEYGRTKGTLVCILWTPFLTIYYVIGSLFTQNVLDIGLLTTYPIYLAMEYTGNKDSEDPFVHQLLARD